MTTEELKAACDTILGDSALRPEYVGEKVKRTFCNIGARRVAQAGGCHELDGADLNADAMLNLMSRNESGKWSKVAGVRATEHALLGGLGFAGMTSTKLQDEHGHIATIYPRKMEASGSLGCEIPFVANIGRKKQPLCEKVSAAFPVALGEPDYFIWTQGAKA